MTAKDSQKAKDADDKSNLTDEQLARTADSNTDRQMLEATNTARQEDDAELAARRKEQIAETRARFTEACNNGDVDAVEMFEMAVQAAQTDRYRRNPHLNALVRQYQVQQTAIREHQTRLDQRVEDRKKQNDEADKAEKSKKQQAKAA